MEEGSAVTGDWWVVGVHVALKYGRKVDERRELRSLIWQVRMDG